MDERNWRRLIKTHCSRVNLKILEKQRPKVFVRFFSFVSLCVIHNNRNCYVAIIMPQNKVVNFNMGLSFCQKKGCTREEGGGVWWGEGTLAHEREKKGSGITDKEIWFSRITKISK